ncbi:acetyltransferase [Listeria aquatica]|uniref:Acetyltransferase n=2 Tax=Listeria aquatica TaxID=1494960 RepID=A0A841ZJN5_9LIST|nr:acetyltransferase [Listeria aquatica]
MDMTPKGIVIIGSGSQGRMLQNLFKQYKLGYQFLGFLDDQHQKYEHNGQFFEAPIDYYQELLEDDVHFFLAIGNVEDRMKIASHLKIPTEKYAIIVHPKAYVDPTVELSHGVYVSAHASIMHDVTIGEHTSIQSGAVVEYESRLNSFVNISPRATLCGNVQIADQVFIGAGATIIQGLTVAEKSIVGAGAAVIRDVPENHLALGVPAKNNMRLRSPNLYVTSRMDLGAQLEK